MENAARNRTSGHSWPGMRVAKISHSSFPLCTRRIKEKRRNQKAQAWQESAGALHAAPSGVPGAQVPADAIPEQCRGDPPRRGAAHLRGQGEFLFLFSLESPHQKVNLLIS